ncbi:hypothetical protein DFH08DRAFT_812736 [Mycena albidolilacea]|uniref:Uncharacterized protein n=1 Tax=Mycena albidolilacea TaxID=1033008 RepID=A0AAD7ELK3_9AGAR|nr:hypothetical protein DFH08DRAFT_812736 [Mycena albidolilacea]
MGRDDPALRFRGHKRRRSQAQTEHMSQLNSARSSMTSLHTQPGADKENRVSSDVGKAQERANAYQRSYYNTTKKLKRVHTANADQAAVLAETRVKNGHLRSKVEQLGTEVTDLEAESSIHKNLRDKHEQVVHMKDVRDKNVERDVTRQKRVDKAQEAIASTVAIASVEALEAAYLIAPRADGYLSVAALDLQLDWHLANPVPGLPGSEETSASGIPKAKTGPKGRGTRETRFEYLKQAISRRSRTTETPAADPSAAVEEPVPLEVSSMDVDDGAYDSEEDFYGPRRGLGL